MPYPLPRPEADSRFTIGLVIEISEVLQRHGYPKPEGVELVDLQQALFNFLYAAPSEDAER